MNKTLKVGFATLLKFIGQFFFLKSLSNISDSSLLNTLNFQSLAVLLSGFSSGGVQTYLSKHIPKENIRSAWLYGIRSSTNLFLIGVALITPFYYYLNHAQQNLSLILSIIAISLPLAYSNNWQGLLTGQKKYHSLLKIYSIQFIIFCTIFIFNKSLGTHFFYFAYPGTIILSTLLVSNFDKKILESYQSPNHSSVRQSIDSHKILGIVIMTVGSLYPFLIRNLLTGKLPLTEVLTLDYSLRISTTYSSVTSFFFFTYFASDISKDRSKTKLFVLMAVLLLVSYLTVFSQFNDTIFKILLSRNIQLECSQLSSFIFFEISRGLFSIASLVLIMSNRNTRYVFLELINLFITVALVYLTPIESITKAFYALGASMILSAFFLFIFRSLLKKFSSER